MAYTSKFASADLLITQLQSFIIAGMDPLLLSSWAALIAVKGVTAYELAIKEICEDFARKKNGVFGVFVKSSYDKLNGRISYNDLKNGIVKPYGDKYSKRLVQKKDAKTAIVFATEKLDLVDTYNNLITCRNQFVHAGVFTLSFAEAVRYYQIGKKMIEVLDETMKR